MVHISYVITPFKLTLINNHEDEFIYLNFDNNVNILNLIFNPHYTESCVAIVPLLFFSSIYIFKFS